VVFREKPDLSLANFSIFMIYKNVELPRESGRGRDRENVLD
jgi:hypothetical protein